MPQAYDPKTVARFIADAHAQRARYQNLPTDIAPKTVSEAYAAQEALRELWVPKYGPVAGRKIAVTTKIMQELMGIHAPIGGLIYQKCVHASPATIRLAEFQHVVIEFELAVRLARALPARATPYTGAEAQAAVGEAMAAYELIEDRHAVYKDTDGLSLTADNAWNAGIVLGPAVKLSPARELDGLATRLTSNGRDFRHGVTDDPMGALAWVANLAAERGEPLQAGMVVITGSTIATLPIAPGERFKFEIDGIGCVEMAAE